MKLQLLEVKKENNIEINKENEEIEIIPPKPKYKCEGDCGKAFSHLEHCRDGKYRCKHCQKRMVTNKFYDPNWRIKQQFVGKFSMSAQEKSIIMTQQIKQGKTYIQAKNRVEYDERQMKKSKGRKYFTEKAAEAEAQIKKQQDSEMNKRFLEGLIVKK